MAADLIIYGIIAAGLVLWLKNILGTRHGEERQRPNPFEAKPPSGDVDQIENTIVNIHSTNEATEEKITALFDSPKNNLSVANDAAKAGLLDIAKADKTFNVAKFMESAQDAFVFIVESFAEGDRETLEDLLSKNVYKAFDQAITAREKDGHTMQMEIHAFRKVEVTEANVKGKKASITVLFSADETSVIRNEKDKIISGNPERITEMRDLWVFTRDINSRDPRWLVAETRDVDGDNETIPNA